MSNWRDTVMDEEEKLVCSLVSEYSLKKVHDVIDETCIHQAEISFPLGKLEGIKLVGEWLAKKPKRTRIPVYGDPEVVWSEVETLLRGEMPR